MSLSGRYLIVLLVGSLALPLSARAAPPAEFVKLEAQLMAAHQAYRAAVAELVEKHPGFDPDDKSKYPRDKRPTLLAELDKLAGAGVTGPDGLDMAGTVFAWSLELEYDETPARFGRLAEHFPDAADHVAQLKNLEYAYTYGGAPQAWVSVGRKLQANTTKSDIREAAAMFVARVLIDTGKLDDAKRGLKKLIKEAPKSVSAQRAEGFIFEIDHLQVGMRAPDFQVTTLDGKKLNLRTLRGKAVLLNFWATW